MCPVSSRLTNGRGSYFGSGLLICHCLLVESNDGLVLVDTGLGRLDVQQPKERLPHLVGLIARPRLDPAETAIAQVERLGFRREDVRHIMLTHGDFDHAGGIADFPAASVHLYVDEHRAMTAPETVFERARYRSIQWSHGPHFVPCALTGERWEGFDAVRAIPGASEELLMIPLAGHTRGHAAIAVRAEGRWLLHAGDAYFHREQLDPVRPRIPAGLGAFQRLVDFDHEGRVRNQERLRTLSNTRGGEIDVFCAHDPVELERFAAQRPASGESPARSSGLSGISASSRLL